MSPAPVYYVGLCCFHRNKILGVKIALRSLTYLAPRVSTSAGPALDWTKPVLICKFAQWLPSGSEECHGPPSPWPIRAQDSSPSAQLPLAVASSCAGRQTEKVNGADLPRSKSSASSGSRSTQLPKTYPKV